MSLRPRLFKPLAALLLAVALAPSAGAVPLDFQFTTTELIGALEDAGLSLDDNAIFSLGFETTDLTYTVSTVGMPDPSWIGSISGTQAGIQDLPGDATAVLVTTNSGFAGQTVLTGAPTATGAIMPGNALWSFSIDTPTPVTDVTNWIVSVFATPLAPDGAPLGPIGITQTEPLLYRVQFDAEGRLILDPVVPEPATLALTALGLSVAAARRRRRRRG